MKELEVINMGLIRAAAGAVSGTLADSWLEYITAGDMGANTVLTRGVQIKRGKHGSNTKGTPDIISNGSRIEVCLLYPYEGHSFFHFADFKRLTDRAYRKISKSSSPRSPLGVHIRRIRKKAATVSVTALFHSGTGSET